MAILLCTDVPLATKVGKTFVIHLGVKGTRRTVGYRVRNQVYGDIGQGEHQRGTSILHFGKGH